jgi:hypothetical protein
MMVTIADGADANSAFSGDRKPASHFCDGASSGAEHRLRNAAEPAARCDIASAAHRIRRCGCCVRERACDGGRAHLADGRAPANRWAWADRQERAAAWRAAPLPQPRAPAVRRRPGLPSLGRKPSDPITCASPSPARLAAKRPMSSPSRSAASITGWRTAQRRGDYCGKATIYLSREETSEPEDRPC